jgi:hypothetical protein
MMIACRQDKKLNALPKKMLPTIALAAVIFGIAGLSALWLLVIAGLSALWSLLIAGLSAFWSVLTALVRPQPPAE